MHPDQKFLYSDIMKYLLITFLPVVPPTILRYLVAGNANCRYNLKINLRSLYHFQTHSEVLFVGLNTRWSLSIPPRHRYSEFPFFYRENRPTMRSKTLEIRCYNRQEWPSKRATLEEIPSLPHYRERHSRGYRLFQTKVWLPNLLRSNCPSIVISSTYPYWRSYVLGLNLLSAPYLA